MLLEQFAHRLPSDDCLEWPHAKSADGYGQTCVEGRTVYVHRIAFTEANGREPTGEVRHSCDNPPCFNPAHLLDGTHRQNAHDMLRRMRQPAIKLDWERAAAIRASYSAGDITQRQLAEQHGISQCLVWRIIHGKSWPEEAVA